MDQSMPQPGFTKPIGGFLVVLTVALLVGGWLYVDSVRNELDMRIDALDLRQSPKVVETAGTKEKMEPTTFKYNGLSFEIPGDWSVDRTASEGDAVFLDRSGKIVAELDCQAQYAIEASPFETVIAERTTAPDGTRAQLFLHQSLGDSDVLPGWTLQMEYLSATAPCRLNARTVEQRVMERALETVTMAGLY